MISSGESRKETIMDTIKISAEKKPLMIAHRGCSGLELENTNAAFVAAGNRSYFGIETDVHKTIDGKYVVFHDDTTGRLAIDDLAMKASTYDTLRRLTLLNKYTDKKDRSDLVISDLSEYLCICKHYEKKAVVELNTSFTEQDMDDICEIIEEIDYLDQAIIISFNLDQLIYLRRKYPNQPLQFLTGARMHVDWLNMLKEHHIDLNISHKELTKELVDLCHANGIKVNVWTLDNKERAELLAAWGVDMITSNVLE